MSPARGGCWISVLGIPHRAQPIFRTQAVKYRLVGVLAALGWEIVSLEGMHGSYVPAACLGSLACKCFAVLLLAPCLYSLPKCCDLLNFPGFCQSGILRKCPKRVQCSGSIISLHANPDRNHNCRHNSICLHCRQKPPAPTKSSAKLRECPTCTQLVRHCKLPIAVS